MENAINLLYEPSTYFDFSKYFSLSSGDRGARSFANEST
jgi:hypothetical protein